MENQNGDDKNWRGIEKHLILSASLKCGVNDGQSYYLPEATFDSVYVQCTETLEEDTSYAVVSAYIKRTMRTYT